MTSSVAAARGLIAEGFVVVPAVHELPHQAWEAADRVIRLAAEQDALCQRFPLEVVAEYTIPPPTVTQRSFQVLHIDFGLPLALADRTDVARYTTLHVDASVGRTDAVTRIVPLTFLARQRVWPTARELAARLRSRDGDPDVAEGILARIVEAADQAAELPTKAAASFRCGLEFDTIEAERSYLIAHGLDTVSTERAVVLQPGQSLVIDNLGCAHGRLGIRATGELHQRCLGFAGLSPVAQEIVLLHALAHLTGAA